MIELLELLLASILRSRRRLLLENLLPRQQFQVALRGQPRPRLRTRDKLFWLLVRRLHRDWRRHLLLVMPEPVLAWHRQGWRLFWRWRSRDRVYGTDFATRIAELCIESVRTPVQAPRANAIGERVVRSLRRACLDHIQPLSEGYVRSLLVEFVSYYNHERPHRSLGLETPVPRRRPVHGEVVSRVILGGLHHVYERAA